MRVKLKGSRGLHEFFFTSQPFQDPLSDSDAGPHFLLYAKWITKSKNTCDGESSSNQTFLSVLYSFRKIPEVTTLHQYYLLVYFFFYVSAISSIRMKLEERAKCIRGNRIGTFFLPCARKKQQKKEKKKENKRRVNKGKWKRKLLHISDVPKVGDLILTSFAVYWKSVEFVA